MSTSDIRITDLKPLDAPRSYIESQPITPEIAEVVINTRKAIDNIGNGTASRMMMLAVQRLDWSSSALRPKRPDS